MLLWIIFFSVAISITLANYFKRRWEQRQEDARERREEQFIDLLDSIKKRETEKPD